MHAVVMDHAGRCVRDVEGCFFRHVQPAGAMVGLPFTGSILIHNTNTHKQARGDGLLRARHARQDAALRGGRLPILFL